VQRSSLLRDIAILLLIGLIGAVTWVLNYHLVNKTRWAR